MIVRFYGARGSIPVSGKEYLKYGGNTTCVEIRTNDDEIIIIDAGSGIRVLGNRLISEDRFRYTMIFTHAHWDHIMGFPFFQPIYSKKTKITMYGCPFAQASVREIIAKIMAPPNFPVKFEDMRAEIIYHEACEEAFQIKSMSIISIPLSHPNQGMGYRFSEGGKSFVFLTDNELTFKHEGGVDYAAYLDFSAGADLLVHDAEFTEEEYEKKTKTWGHSIYRDALRLALDAGAKRFGLFHHNQERSDKALDEIVTDCRRIIKESGKELECFAVHQGLEISL
ncbi:MAG TPA: MBL fold metallo-hydrolase [Syntrophales bacterium]|nr:MBL fold metallo-hydrolase [Syntrophales bacterium]